MDISFIKSRLKEGEQLKNRKELCKRLGEEYYNQTNQKHAQDKRWNCFFEFEKIKGTQGIKITKIYDKEKCEFRAKGSIMPEFLDPAILLYIRKNKDVDSIDLWKKYFTIAEIAVGVGICNEYVTKFYSSDKVYEELKRKYSSSSYSANENDEESKTFKSMASCIPDVRNSYRNRITGSLGRLQRKNLIKIEPVTLITNQKDLNHRINYFINEKKYDEIKKLVAPSIYEEIETEIISKEEKPKECFIYETLANLGITDDRIRKATEIEKAYIKEIQTEVLRKYQCEDIRELYRKYALVPNMIKKYFAECNKRYKEYNIENFQAYEIKWVNSWKNLQIEHELGELKGKVNEEFIKHYRQTMNKKIEKKAEKRFEKFCEEFYKKPGLGQPIDDRAEYILLSQINLNKFIEDFIKIKDEDSEDEVYYW